MLRFKLSPKKERTSVNEKQAYEGMLDAPKGTLTEEQRKQVFEIIETALHPVWCLEAILHDPFKADVMDVSDLLKTLLFHAHDAVDEKLGKMVREDKDS